MKIGHIADIHIRGLNRHDEYKEVFEKFAEECKRNHVDHIFVGGDIWHTKTQGMTPEYVDFMSWWIDALSEVAPLHLVLGNHDGNLINQTRQDAISPIVMAKKRDNVFLYKQSGVYEFAPGYNWCVYSLFDEDNWSAVKPVPGAFNIACYHGPVVSAQTETGWEVEEGLTIDFFESKGYDLVLLGDIHKTQYLAFKEVEIEIEASDLHKYPGATILRNNVE